MERALSTPGVPLHDSSIIINKEMKKIGKQQNKDNY